MENKESNLNAESKLEDGLTPSELVKKHIANKEHVITNEELDHLKTGTEADDKVEFEKEVDEKLEEDNLKESHKSNPYDILDI